MGRWDSSDDEDNNVSKSQNDTKRKEGSTFSKKRRRKIEENKELPTAPTTTSSLVAPKSSGLDRTALKNPLFYGCSSIERYEWLSYVDQGTYGAVFRAKCLSTGDIVAVKQVKLGEECSKIGFPISAFREANILLSLQHPNIIRVREMVVGSSIDKIYMVMDYYDNDLRYCMNQGKEAFTLSQVKRLMMQLLSAVDYMHSKWYIHRDLKTSNLLYSNSGNLCVCDFGMARKYSSPIVPYTHEVVTLYYRSPEVLMGSTLYDTALDMWSVGCIFGELFTGLPIFQGEGEVDQLYKIFRGVGYPTAETWPEYFQLPMASKLTIKKTSRGNLRDNIPQTSFAGNVFLNATGFHLLDQMLCLNPSQRISAKNALAHPWFSEAPLPQEEVYMPKFSSRHEKKKTNSATPIVESGAS